MAECWTFLLSGAGDWPGFPESIKLLQVAIYSPQMQLCTVCLDASQGDGLRQLATPDRY